MIETVDLTTSSATAVDVGCSDDFIYVPIDDTLNVVNAQTFDVDTISLTCTEGRGIVILCDPQPLSVIPTLSEWGLIAMAGILGIIGFMVLRRRKITV